MEAVKTFRTSQTTIKAFEEEKQDGCMLRWKWKFIEGKKTPPSLLMQKGNLFEYHVLGATAFEKEPFFPKHKTTGAKLKAETDIEELAEYNKKAMADKGIKILEVQPKLYTNDTVCHLDAIIEYNGRKAIMDLKYTETQENDWRYGWGMPEEMDHLQAVKYVLKWNEVYKELLPFYYWVAGASGWIKFIKIEVTEGAITQYYIRVNNFWEQFRKEKFLPNPEFNRCIKCPFNSECKYKSVVPEEIVVQY